MPAHHQPKPSWTHNLPPPSSPPQLLLFPPPMNATVTPQQRQKKKTTHNFLKKDKSLPQLHRDDAKKGVSPQQVCYVVVMTRPACCCDACSQMQGDMRHLLAAAATTTTTVKWLLPPTYLQNWCLQNMSSAGNWLISSSPDSKFTSSGGILVSGTRILLLYICIF